MDWISLNDVKITEKTNMLHCDTRDFHCLLREDVIDLRDGKHPEITKVLYNEDYNIEQTSIVPWLESLERMSGGKGNWRMLSFDVDGARDWLKYIRLYRNPKRKTEFVVCNRSEVPIKWRFCDEDNLQKDLLNLCDED